MPKKQSAVAKKVTASTTANAMEETNVREMVAREAYLRAEKRGFNSGDPVQDWLEAEKDVNAMLDMVEN
ncbi:MAG: DUF2934 domain-containing protein [Gammaproteobacteria bacterium]|nr:DUF2934 domain-containing protein [Gammaproteobacteria bacterium]